MSVQSTLNTFVYLGGAPYDTDGDDTYHLQGWSEDAYLARIFFVRDLGDAMHTRVQIYDRDAESAKAKLLFEDTFGPHQVNDYTDEDKSVLLKGSKRGRLHVRLIAMDGSEQNHCKIVFRGKGA